MKLRNKQTGEIAEIFSISCKSLRTFLRFYDNRGDFKFECNSLAELNEEWEDYEEPEKYCYMTSCGEVTHRGYRLWENESVYDKKRKEIGNYFETKEEAEQAVEKLKAWKRLKDKGLTFCAWKITDDGCSVDVETTLDAEIVRAQQKFITDDLDLLFGGEE